MHTTSINAYSICITQWAQTVLQDAGCPVALQSGAVRSTGRLLQELKTGVTDVLADVSDTPERRLVGHFSAPHSEEQVRLYARPGDVSRWPVQRLCDATMQAARVTGPLQGWLGPEWSAVQNGAQNKSLQCGRVSLYAENDNIGAAAVRDGRMDLLVVTDWAVRHMTARNQAALQALPVFIHRSTGHMMLSRLSVRESDLQRINIAIQRRLAQNGPPCGRAAVTTGQAQPRT